MASGNADNTSDDEVGFVCMLYMWPKKSAFAFFYFVSISIEIVNSNVQYNSCISLRKCYLDIIFHAVCILFRWMRYYMICQMKFVRISKERRYMVVLLIIFYAWTVY